MTDTGKPPTWGGVIGVLGILFGALGLLGGTYELIMPSMFEMQEKMMVSMKEAAREAEEKRAAQPPCPDSPDRGPQMDPTAVFDGFQEMWNVPPWYKKWMVVNGAMQLLLGAGYILASIFLLIVRSGAPTVFVGVAAISMLRNMIALGLGISAGSFMAFWSISSAAAGFLIDLVLIVVVLVSDRSAYFKQRRGEA